MSIRVMLAEEQALVREGIKMLLEAEGDMQVTVQESVEKCLEGLFGCTEGENAMPQVLLLSMEPQEKDYGILRRVKERMPEIRILLLSGCREPEYPQEAFQMGADGYLTKYTQPFAFLKCIRRIIDSNTCCWPQWNLKPENQQPQMKEEAEKQVDIINLLTNREKEILLHVSRGMLNKEIGVCLNITEQTVKNHISNILRKLDLSDRTQAAVFAVRNEEVFQGL